MANFRVRETASSGGQKKAGWGSEAIIEEVAAQRCGGMAGLQRALKRGAVKVLEKGAWGRHLIHLEFRMRKSHI